MATRNDKGASAPTQLSKLTDTELLTVDELQDVFKDRAAFSQWYISLSLEQRQTIENLVAEFSENPKFAETLLGVNDE